MWRIPILFLTGFFAFTVWSTAQDRKPVKTCLDCHGKLVSRTLPHKPVKEGCQSCHVPNGKKHPQEEVEGFALVKKTPELCFSCHTNRYGEEHVHKPVHDGDCAACHDNHSANEPHLLSTPLPKACYFCHTDLRDTVAKSSLVHGGMTTERTCLACHNPHASAEKKILVREEKALCFSCHNQPVKTGERTLRDMKTYIEKSKYVHGTIDNNGCVVCHNPHASNTTNLLKEAYPRGSYAQGRKDQYGLCFSSCHESTMIEDSLSRETGFRNGSRNLHYVHVVRDKGRSCLNCHDVHASNSLYLLKSTTWFGEWEMPLNYKRAGKGGSCAPGCHNERSYQK